MPSVDRLQSIKAVKHRNAVVAVQLQSLVQSGLDEKEMRASLPARVLYYDVHSFLTSLGNPPETGTYHLLFQWVRFYTRVIAAKKLFRIFQNDTASPDSWSLVTRVRSSSSSAVELAQQLAVGGAYSIEKPQSNWPLVGVFRISIVIWSLRRSKVP